MSGLRWWWWRKNNSLVWKMIFKCNVPRERFMSPSIIMRMMVESKRRHYFHSTPKSLNFRNHHHNHHEPGGFYEKKRYSFKEIKMIWRRKNFFSLSITLISTFFTADFCSWNISSAMMSQNFPWSLETLSCWLFVCCSTQNLENLSNQMR